MKTKYILFIISILLLTSCMNASPLPTESKNEPSIEKIDESSDTKQQEETKSSNNEIIKEKYKVIRVIDGDTIEAQKEVLTNINQETITDKIRLIGINTPETLNPNTEVETYGKEASDYTKSILEGNYVYLEKDVSDTDQYGRLLRYVYLENGTFFNEQLIKEGYAKLATYPPDVKYVEVFKEAQAYARDNEKGLWGIESIKQENSKEYVDENGRGLIKGNSNSMIYHMPDGTYYDNVKNPIYFKTEEEAMDAGYRKSKK